MKNRILIVDDSQVNLKLLRAILRQEGFALLEASHGRQALELARTERPDLILLDVMMPEMDGFEVLEKITEDPATRQIPVIFLSAKAEAADKVRGLDLGAVDYVTKPFHRGEVLARVRTQLRIAELTRSLLREQARVEEDLRAAADIQKTLILRASQGGRDVKTATCFEPCDQIGGDIFNAVNLDADHLGLYVVDVSGHGVPSAMVTVSVAQSLSPQTGLVFETDSADGTSRVRGPREVLELLDREYPMERFGKYFTMSYLVLDLRSGVLKYASAAHPPPLLVRANGSSERLDAGGPLIGMGIPLPFEEGETKLARGDRLFLFTDGIVEHAAHNGNQFGAERLEALLADDPSADLQALCDRVMEAVHSHGRGRKPADDISLLAVEFEGLRVQAAA